MFRDVEASAEVEVVSAHHEFHPYDAGRIEDLEQMLREDFDYRVAPSIREIVNFPEEVSLFWQYKGEKGEDEIFGEFHIENFINVVSLDKNEVKVYNEDLPEETKALMRKARYFDPQPSLGWNTATVLVPEEGREVPGLWLLDDSKMHRLSIDLEQYFEVLFLTKGMYYWQYLFSTKAAYDDTPYYKKRAIARILDVLPSAFPDKEYSPLRERFQGISG